jgi:hypothetical protein
MTKSLLFVVGFLAVSLTFASAAEGTGRKLLEAGPYNTKSGNSGTDLNRGNDVKNKGSVSGDPVLSAFDGQRFEFHGKAEHFYNLASEAGVFQVLHIVLSRCCPTTHCLYCTRHVIYCTGFLF